MNRPLRVLHIIESLATGGAEQQLVRLLQAHDRSKVEPHVIALFERDDLAGPLREQGIPVELFNMRSKRQIPLVLRRLRASLRAGRFEVVHTWLTWADLLGRTAAMLWSDALVVSAAQAPIYEPEVYRDNPQIKPWKLELVRQLDRWTGSWAGTHTIACSQTVASSVQRRLHRRAQTITTIYNAVPHPPISQGAAELRQKLGLTGSPLLLHVGRLDPQKGQRYLIEAFAQMHSHTPEARLYIIGSGPLESTLRALCRAWNVGDAVEFLGLRQDVAQFMAACDLFLFPSLWEGMALALLEALAAGMPVIASDIPSLREVIEPGINGLLVAPGDTQALAQAMISLGCDPLQQAALGKAGRQRALERFAIETAAHQVEALYLRLLESRQ